MFRSLIHFEFIFVYGIRKCSSFIFFTSHWPVFPTPRVKKIVFSLYILASFVKDKVSIGAWIYLWAFYFVPLFYISVFVPVPYCLDDCGFVVDPEVKFIAIKAYLKKQEKSKINNLTLHLKQIEKEEIKIPRVSRRKEI